MTVSFRRRLVTIIRTDLKASSSHECAFLALINLLLRVERLAVLRPVTSFAIALSAPHKHLPASPLHLVILPLLVILYNVQ